MPQKVSKSYIAQTRNLFHCHIKIKIPEYYDESILDEGFAILEAIDRQYNSYQRGSFFWNINQNAGNWVAVDEATIHMLETSLKIAEWTDGVYDATSMPLIRAWGFYDREVCQPSQSTLADALEKVNYQQVQIRDSQVKIQTGQELITGSFIKAYAVDQLVQWLKALGINDAILNAGGSTIYALNDEDHPYWQVNIPGKSDTGGVADSYQLSNACFSLSARAHHFVEIAGKRYGHILNAKTGFPSSNWQAGVISSEAFTGDMVSTALFATPRDCFAAQCCRLSNHLIFKAFLMDEQGGVQYFDFPKKDEREVVL